MYFSHILIYLPLRYKKLLNIHICYTSIGKKDKKRKLSIICYYASKMLTTNQITRSLFLFYVFLRVGYTTTIKKNTKYINKKNYYYYIMILLY